MVGGDNNPREFSLVRGGPAFHLARALRFSTETVPGITRTCLVASAIAWLPLLVLAIAQGVAYGDLVVIPLLRDLASYARYWVAIPLFIVAEVGIDRRLTMAVQSLISRGLVTPAARPDLERALDRVQRGRDSWLPEILMLAVALAWGWIGLGRQGMGEATTWATL